MEIFIREYLSSLNNFLNDSGITDPSGVTPKHLNDFFGLLTKLGLSSRSSARYYSSLKGFFGYLFSSSYIEINPMEKVSAPKVTKGLPNVLNINEIESILSAP